MNAIFVKYLSMMAILLLLQPSSGHAQQNVAYRSNAADDQTDVEWLCGKIVNLRIFDDEQGVMNCSVKEVEGNVLLVSQFTLHASTKKGNRPSYIRASKPATAIPLYEKMIEQLEQEMGTPIETGEFGADMQIELINDGPVTICIDSRARE